MNTQRWHGAGLGLRRELIALLANSIPPEVDFLEIAPENWIGIGGGKGHVLRELAEQVPIVAHGLCLNLGGFAPLDRELIAGVDALMRELRMPFYSEHLSYCADEGCLYDLMPIPFTSDAVGHVARRIRQVQDMLDQRIGVENVSYYAAAPIDEMDEASFLRAVVQEADCLIHLDVNNVFVNSVNHGIDPYAYIASMPSQRIAYYHVAGHLRESESLVIDTHGADVIDSVWGLLEHAYMCHGVRPTLLERDFNFPPLGELLVEVGRIAQTQDVTEGNAHAHAA
ncbi:DUF692 domain-containing protein [Burkholderia ubonensis]|uniref:Uncharacterized protein n=1 Tax=Burkholderia ubonensis TaxID=101571 RepID=A0A119HGZ0_9BURK|nr:DUF692 domain-containing protein [Burkholderia ubonensis]KVZ45753.1 hypothetical protein WL16_22790 [Burkholderia ubonensis]KWA86265.1 hypothetical protein WL29_11005 [Burkholderia ubonensis]KWB92031.1 hypothetical protein WL43_02610 [Burkholderia ubonensis]KWZ58768.1 hypothetical protein WK57_16945 [Burkholderia ubonensis]